MEFHCGCLDGRPNSNMAMAHGIVSLQGVLFCIPLNETKTALSAAACARRRKLPQLRLHCPSSSSCSSSSSSSSSPIPVRRRKPLHVPAAVSADQHNATSDTQPKPHDYETYQALLRGGEDVSSVMKTMTELLEDIKGLEEEDEGLAVEIAAAGAIGQKLDSLDGSFLLALDWMIKQADTEKDDKRKQVLEIIKDAVLGQLSDKCPPHVQVLGMLCQTPLKEKRHEILRRSAGGGGVFDTESGGKLTIPKANLNDIATQADNLIAGMEEKPRIQDRRLLSKLVVLREEARSMLCGGLQDERNDNRGFKALPETEVNFVSKIVGIRPGPSLREKLVSVMKGKDEGEDLPEDESSKKVSSKEGIQRLPVRPGMFLEAITKVLSGMYETKTAGVAVQQLEWIHRETLKILEEIGYS